MRVCIFNLSLYYSIFQGALISEKARIKQAEEHLEVQWRDKFSECEQRFVNVSLEQGALERQGALFRRRVLGEIEMLRANVSTAARIIEELVLEAAGEQQALHTKISDDADMADLQPKISTLRKTGARRSMRGLSSTPPPLPDKRTSLSPSSPTSASGGVNTTPPPDPELGEHTNSPSEAKRKSRNDSLHFAHSIEIDPNETDVPMELEVPAEVPEVEGETVEDEDVGVEEAEAGVGDAQLSETELASLVGTEWFAAIESFQGLDAHINSSLLFGVKGKLCEHVRTLKATTSIATTIKPTRQRSRKTEAELPVIHSGRRMKSAVVPSLGFERR